MKNIQNPQTLTPAPEEKKQVATPTATTSTPGADLKSDEIFGMMAAYLAKGEGKPLIPKVAAVFGFEI